MKRLKDLYGSEMGKHLNTTDQMIAVQFAEPACKETRHDVCQRHGLMRYESAVPVPGYRYTLLRLPAEDTVRAKSSQDFWRKLRRDQDVTTAIQLRQHGRDLSFKDNRLVLRLCKGTSMTRARLSKLKRLGLPTLCYVIPQLDTFLFEPYEGLFARSLIRDVSEALVDCLADCYLNTVSVRLPGLHVAAPEGDPIEPGKDSNVDQFEAIQVNDELIDSYSEGLKNVRVAVVDNGVTRGREDLNLDLGFDATQGVEGVPDTDQKKHDPSGGHGTACAGLIGATRADEKSIRGVASGVALFSCKCLADNDVAAATDALRLAKALTEATDLHADVISVSLTFAGGSSNDQTLIRSALTHTKTGRNGAGCIVVAAAGNDGRDTLPAPASGTNVIAVGGCKLLSGSWVPAKKLTQGSWATNAFDACLVTSAAEGLVSTRWKAVGNKNFVSFSMTSAACPQIAGLAALMLAKNPALKWTTVMTYLDKSKTKKEKLVQAAAALAKVGP